MNTRRDFLRQIGIGSAVLAMSRWAAGMETLTSSTTDYNVLFLMDDQHNPHVLGCYGDPLVKTTTLDSLAAVGLRFTSAYCQNPICVPSRVSMVSGMMPCHLNQFDNTNTQEYPNITTMADVFNQAGYRTAWIGKSHFGIPRFTRVIPLQRNSTQNAVGDLPQTSRVSNWPISENPEHTTVNEAITFLQNNRNRKFFLGVSLVKPHPPYTIQAKYFDLYKDKVTMPRVTPELIADLPNVAKEQRIISDFADITNAQTMRTKALYYGMVNYIDDEFGRVLQKLDELGLREKTIIIYTADHGEMLGDRGLWYKYNFFDQSARIPFIWSFPKALPQGKVIDAPVMNMDIFPTLCDLCNVPKPSTLEGSSLLPLMQGTDDGSTRYAISEHYRFGYVGRMIRTASWKYFFYTDNEEYLYDMQADPGEENNLIGNPAYRQLADDLKQKATVNWLSNGFAQS